MEGIIANFRTSRHRPYPNQMVVRVGSVDTRDKAAKLVGKKVVYTTPGKNTITGKISAAHGNKGAVRVLFEKGMPGQAFGQKVKIE